MLHAAESFGSDGRGTEGGKAQPAFALLPEARAGGTDHAALRQQASKPVTAVMFIGAAHPEIGSGAVGPAGSAGQSHLPEGLLHHRCILPVDGKRLLPLPQTGGGKCGFGGTLNGITDPITVTAQPFFPCGGAAGCQRHHDPAAAYTGKSVGFREGADLNGTVRCAGDGIDAAGQAASGKKGGIGGIHQQHTAACLGKVYPTFQFGKGHHGAGGVIGGAEHDQSAFFDLLRLGQKVLFLAAGERKNRVSGGFGGGAVGGGCW